jgi:sarcosine oxidase subunit gamma
MLDLSNTRSALLPAWTNDKNSGVTLAEAPVAQRFILRGDMAAEVAGQVFGVALPRKPMRSATSANRNALWLGPDEWLLLTETPAPSLLGKLTEALHGVPYSLVDVSDRQVAITASGPNAAAALSMFIPLDLALTAFPVGMATRTIFEKAEIILWRRGMEEFHLEIWRSFAPYVANLLEHARDELAAEIQTPR